jgi:hypothetical protein
MPSATVYLTPTLTKTTTPVFRPSEVVTATSVPPTQMPVGWCVPGGNIEPSFHVIGYWPDYEPLNMEVGNCLTDIIFFSVEPAIDGKINTTRVKPQFLDELMQLEAKYGTRIHLAVGGYKRSDNFAFVAERKKLREQFINNLLEFCLKYKMSGVNYDWEFPASKAEVKAYADLISETRDIFHEKNLTVTVAVYPSPDLDLSPYLLADQILVMSYDRGVRHATLQQAEEDMAYFVQAGIPKHKIILGIPFYGRQIASPYKAYAYNAIVEKYFPLPETDEVDGIYYNGRNTVQSKTCLAREMGVGGVMIWELGQDSYGVYSLLRAIYKGATDHCSFQ